MSSNVVKVFGEINKVNDHRTYHKSAALADIELKDKIAAVCCHIFHDVIKVSPPSPDKLDWAFNVTIMTDF